MVSFVAVTSVYFFMSANKKADSSKAQEIVFWSLQMGTFDSYMRPLIAEFEKENPDLTINWIDVPYSEGEKRTLASILSNTPPDLVNLTPDFSSVLAQKQALEFIDCNKLDVYNEQIINSLKQDGKCYAVPFYATSALTFYNKEILNEANIINIPTTYNELNSIAKQIKDKTSKFVTMPTLTENDTLLKILNKYEINTYNKLLSDKSISIFNDYKMLYKNGLIPKESITQNHQEALEKYMSGQIVFIQSGANFLNIIKENAPQVYKQTNIANQIVGDNGKYDVSIMNLIIPVRAKNKEGALRFALFLTNKKNQIELAKLTTILPVNKDALSDAYFTTYDETDTMLLARYLSAKQLNNLQTPIKFKNNHKEIIMLLNNTIQQIMLEKSTTEVILKETAKNWERLCK